MTDEGHRVRSVCVYCGSSPGNDPKFAALATALGTELAARRLTLVYGGSRVGLMGAVADAALAADANVVGILPQVIRQRELDHKALSELHLVDSMHERKQLMVDLADAFVVLPGGPGTMDEFFEVFTWLQLGLHHKPIGVLDVDGYWAPLLGVFDSMAANGFLTADHRAMLLYATDAAELLDAFDGWTPPGTPKWQ